MRLRKVCAVAPEVPSQGCEDALAVVIMNAHRSTATPERITTSPHSDRRKVGPSNVDSENPTSGREWADSAHPPWRISPWTASGVAGRDPSTAVACPQLGRLAR